MDLYEILNLFNNFFRLKTIAEELDKVFNSPKWIIKMLNETFCQKMPGLIFGPKLLEPGLQKFLVTHWITLPVLFLLWYYAYFSPTWHSQDFHWFFSDYADNKQIYSVRFSW